MVVTATARIKYLSIPPRKMRIVADLVRGLPVEKALGILNFTPRIAAHHLAKTVKSAAANALSQEGTDHLKAEDLIVRSITVDAAPTAKRVRFRAMGRVYRIRKRFCHLTVKLEGKPEIVVSKKDAGRTAAGKEQAEAKPVAKSRAKTTKSAAAKGAKKKTVAKKTAAKKTSGRAASKAKTKKAEKAEE